MIVNAILPPGLSTKQMMHFNANVSFTISRKQVAFERNRSVCKKSYPKKFSREVSTKAYSVDWVGIAGNAFTVATAIFLSIKQDSERKRIQEKNAKNRENFHRNMSEMEQRQELRNPDENTKSEKKTPKLKLLNFE